MKVDFVYEESLPTVLNFMALHMSLRSNESDSMTGKTKAICHCFGHEIQNCREWFFINKIHFYSFMNELHSFGQNSFRNKSTLLIYFIIIF